MSRTALVWPEMVNNSRRHEIFKSYKFIVLLKELIISSSAVTVTYQLLPSPNTQITLSSPLPTLHTSQSDLDRCIFYSRKHVSKFAMKSTKVLVLSSLLGVGFSAPINQSCPEVHDDVLCQDVMLSIEATAMNTAFPPYPNSTLAGEFYGYLGSLNNLSLGTNKVSGKYNISVSYCKPAVKVEGREDTIQMLLHGVSSTKVCFSVHKSKNATDVLQAYWSGLGYPWANFENEYSWVAHAQSQGYATLAIDNLGNGYSDHPDPLNIVQSPLQIEIMHQIMLRLRAGSLPSISQPYTKIVFATHSYGSIIGRALATIHPTDGADAYILTGAAKDLTGINEAVGAWHLQSASAVDPIRFSNFAPGYVAITPQGFRDSVYSFAGDFDPNFLSYDVSLPHNLAVGEIAGIGSTEPSNFTGPVMVITGRYDQIVCGAGNITIEAADCGVGSTSHPDQERLLFPKASSFESYIPDHTGHNLNTHYSAPESFGAAHAWLTKVGF